MLRRPLNNVSSLVMYEAVTWTSRKVDRRTIEALKVWIWRKIAGVSGIGRLRYEQGKKGDVRKYPTKKDKQA